MVDIKINLLKNRPTLSESEYQRERKVLWYSIMGLIVVAILVVAMSVWSVVLTSRAARIERTITQSSKEIQNLVEANANQVYLKGRLQLITDYLQKRSRVRQALEHILANEVGGTHINSVAFIEENVIRLQLEADDNLVFNEVLAYYQRENGYFTQVVSRGVTRSREGTYQLTLEMTIPVEAS